jgi:large subunit ribosomal protein L25
MEVEKISTTKRTESGSRRMRRLREKGLIPGILYGRKIQATPITATKDDVMRIIHSGKHMFDLELEGKKERALLKEIQYDAFGDNVIHVDFALIAMDEEVTVSVPVLLSGNAIGIAHGGVLQHILKEIQVTCLPADIPDSIPYKVNELDIDSVVHIKDLPPTPRVKYLGGPEQIVLQIVKPVIVEEPAPAAAAAEAAAAEPEVLTKRKPEEGEEEEGKEETKGKGKGKESEEKK